MWQPIETALKDRGARLVWCPSNKCIYAAYWAEGDWYAFGGTGASLAANPTHWMPLPAPPDEEI